jgi:hypothetical protein
MKGTNGFLIALSDSMQEPVACAHGYSVRLWKDENRIIIERSHYTDPGWDNEPIRLVADGSLTALSITEVERLAEIIRKVQTGEIK